MEMGLEVRIEFMTTWQLLSAAWRSHPTVCFSYFLFQVYRKMWTRGNCWFRRKIMSLPGLASHMKEILMCLMQHIQRTSMNFFFHFIDFNPCLKILFLFVILWGISLVNLLISNVLFLRACRLRETSNNCYYALAKGLVCCLYIWSLSSKCVNEINFLTKISHANIKVKKKILGISCPTMRFRLFPQIQIKSSFSDTFF